jgi:hypothetical protein
MAVRKVSRCGIALLLQPLLVALRPKLLAAHDLRMGARGGKYRYYMCSLIQPPYKPPYKQEQRGVIRQRKEHRGGPSTAQRRSGITVSS